jgi:hypothetical protein
MKLSGMLSKVMDNYLCLRGIASIKSLYEISEVNEDIQRDLLEAHKGEMMEFLERGEYAFFPEVILSMNLGLPDGDDSFEKFVGIVDSARDGFNAKIGNAKINFIADENKLIDERRQLKTAQFSFDDDVKLSRIDGNHRLSAAPYLTNDTLIPFCIIVFPTEAEAKNNSRAIFHNINSKQIPLGLEQNIKIIIESSDVFPDSILENDQPFGQHYKFARELLCGTDKLDFSCFPHISKLVSKTKYSFFTDLFRYLLRAGLVNKESAVDEVKNEIVDVENALKEARIIAASPNSAIVGALAYYKISDPDKYIRFTKWVVNNHIADAKDVRLDDLVRIFDRVYDSIPKRVFLARWYPRKKDAEYDDAEYRFKAISEAVEACVPKLKLIDMGTRLKGTFSIREAIDLELPESDIFIADLTGARPNVMVEVGMALKNIPSGRMLFYFKPTDDAKQVPFDLNGYQYHPIKDSRDIDSKVVPALKNIIDELVREG